MALRRPHKGMKMERRRAGEGVPTPRTSGFQLSLEYLCRM